MPHQFFQKTVPPRATRKKQENQNLNSKYKYTYYSKFQIITYYLLFSFSCIRGLVAWWHGFLALKFSFSAFFINN